MLYQKKNATHSIFYKLTKKTSINIRIFGRSIEIMSKKSYLQNACKVSPHVYLLHFAVIQGSWLFLLFAGIHARNPD